MVETLFERLGKLPKDVVMSDVFAEISKWEEESMIECRKRELTTKSGRLHYRCCPELG